MSAGLFKPQLQLLVLHKLSDDKPRSHNAEAVGEQHQDGQCAVQWSALLWEKQEINVDRQLRQQREKPEAHELRHFLLQISSESRVQAQGFTYAP
jgi:hypothetical protein